MSLRAVWTEDHRLHQPSGEVWIGVPVEGDEIPPRGEVMREVLDELGVVAEAPTRHGLGPVLAVHDEGMVDYLRTAYDEWSAAGYTVDPGQDRVVGYVFPHADAIANVPRRWPTSRAARAGVYCMDTMTVLSAGTYEAATAAVDGALTAADMVLTGSGNAYAAVRPPGHHVGTTYFGGSCYLNNAAIAAQYLIDQDVSRVAVVDLDAHHGNGTQQIFYERSDVVYTSIHIDPGAGWFPHFIGFADEVGVGPGRGSNLNLLLSPGDGDDALLARLEQACSKVLISSAEVVVVSLGLDMAAADANSPLEVSSAGFRRAGQMLAELGKPLVVVQEGGYDLASLRRDLAAILSQLSSTGGAAHGLDPHGKR